MNLLFGALLHISSFYFIQWARTMQCGRLQRLHPGTLGWNSETH